MALPTSGPLRFSQLRAEFDDINPVRFGEFYRGGGLVPDAPQNAAIPTVVGDELKVSYFYGATNAIVAVVSGTVENLNIQTLFPTAWTQNIPKQVIIEPGTVIGATGTNELAIIIPDNGFQGTLSITNNGSVQGAGGVASAGGNALQTTIPVEIDNQGEIFAGGGAGGRGGVGGAGQVSGSNPCPVPCTVTCSQDQQQTLCEQCCLPGWFLVPGLSCVNTGQPCQGNRRIRTAACRRTFPCPGTCPGQCPFTNPTAGGQGGAGGVGQGYRPVPSPTPGSASPLPGSPGGAGTNAGRGGAGGDGGVFGTPGAPGVASQGGNVGGSQPGQNGFSAGNYIVGNSNVTWVNLGTVAGGVA